MRWEDERWVKVYTRDTGEWLALGWEAQALFLFALRKSDRAGILKTGKMRTRGLAGMTGMPLDVVERSIPLLLEDGCMRETDGGYIIPNFLAAQEAQTSATQRKRDQRERDRDRALADGMPEKTSGMVIDTMASRSRQEVTRNGHALSSRQEVTPGGHAGTVTPRVDESRRDEKDLSPDRPATPRTELRLEQQEPPRKRKAREEKPTDPRHRPLLDQLVAQGWELGGPRGARAVADLLSRAGETVQAGEAPGEVLRRAGHALQKRRTAPTLFPAVAELWELVTHWQHFADPFRAPAGRGPAPPSDFSRNVPLPERSEFAPPVDDTPF